jgi:uncharacterized BrkB/YihY/UPF0761 family membrane protein
VVLSVPLLLSEAPLILPLLLLLLLLPHTAVLLVTLLLLLTLLLALTLLLRWSPNEEVEEGVTVKAFVTVTLAKVTTHSSTTRSRNETLLGFLTTIMVMMMYIQMDISVGS